MNDIDYEGQTGTRIKISGRKGWRNNRIPMAEQHKDYQRECGKDGGNRKKTLEDRE